MSHHSFRYYAPFVVVLFIISAGAFVWIASTPQRYGSAAPEKYDASPNYGYQPDPGCTSEELLNLSRPHERELKRRECINKARDHQRELDDLTLQTRAAEAVEKANWLAADNLHIARLQAVFTICAFIATAWAAWAAAHAAISADNSFEVALEAIRIQRSNNRPFVTPIEYYLDGPSGQPIDNGTEVGLSFRLVFTNIGDSPAFLTGYASACKTVRTGINPEPLLAETALTESGFPSNHFLAKDTELHFDSSFGFFTALSEDWAQVQKIRMSLYVFGYVEYQDIYEKIRRRGFCFEFNPQADDFKENLFIRSSDSLWYDREILRS